MSNRRWRANSSGQNCRLRPFSAEAGYALPLVLVSIAVLLLYSAQVASRVTREVRVTQVKENSERAFFAAEAGFNRVRARMIARADESTVLSLTGRIETIALSDGTPVGQYELTVTAIGANEYRVVSVGTYGVGPLSAKRIVSGTLLVTGKKPNNDNRVAATYTP